VTKNDVSRPSRAYRPYGKYIYGVVIPSILYISRQSVDCAHEVSVQLMNRRSTSHTGDGDGGGDSPGGEGVRDERGGLGDRDAGFGARLDRDAGFGARFDRDAGFGARLDRDAGFGARLNRDAGFGARLDRHGSFSGTSSFSRTSQSLQSGSTFSILEAERGQQVRPQLRLQNERRDDVQQQQSQQQYQTRKQHSWPKEPRGQE
jgi:hypothetical protein